MMSTRLSCCDAQHRRELQNFRCGKADRGRLIRAVIRAVFKILAIPLTLYYNKIAREENILHRMFSSHSGIKICT